MRTILIFPLKWICVLIVRYIQWRYRNISIKNRYNQTNQILDKLRLLQAILHFFKGQFHAWGYFHPSCVWSKKDEKFYRWLFPQKNFEELEIIVWHNPEAVTYYHNKIYRLQKHAQPNHRWEIKDQLIKWNKWN